MVIFYSYVSLPEGAPINFQIRPKIWLGFVEHFEKQQKHVTSSGKPAGSLLKQHSKTLDFRVPHHNIP